MMLWPKFKALTALAQALIASQLVASVGARSAKGDKVLVVIEPALNRASYSHFWQSLEGMLTETVANPACGVLIPPWAVQLVDSS